MENQLEDTSKNVDFGLDIDKVLNARLIELNSLSKEIKQKSNKLVLQRIPRYMRRRAASHNPKRVPSKFIKQPFASIGNSYVKEKRRKQRKKHVNKLKKKLSIRKRNEKVGRTLLHIWFRKRFALVNELDHLVPLRNNTKNFRNLHKVSTKQCAFYYRPLHRLLEIKFDDAQLLTEALMLMKSFFNTNLDDCSAGELDLFFYKDGVCLAPVSFLQLSESTIWLSIPIDFYSMINQTLNELFSSIHLKYATYECQFERFRLIGPKATKHLESLLKSSSSTGEQSLTDLTLADLFTSSKLYKIISECKFFDQTNLTIAILLKHKAKSIVDVLVPKSLAKKFWYSLVKNKGHLVGGKIDYEYYALQNDFICYPSIGCLDLQAQKESSKLKLLKSILDLSGAKTTNSEDASIVRSHDFLKLFESPFDNLAQITQHYGIIIDKSSFINVKLETIKKGTLNENDLIYLPTEQDLVQLNEVMKMSKEERFANQIVEDSPVEKVKLKKLKLTEETFANRKELRSVLDRSSRKAIGIVELGSFCLKSGRNEAFGVICTNYLIELINQTIRSGVDRNQLNVLIRSPDNCKFRFCTIRVGDFDLF